MDKNANRFKKTWKFLTSMKFGMSLLLLIATLSILGTIIPQEYPLQFYETNYSKLAFELIYTFSLYKVYTSWWFITLIIILSVNLIFCSINRIKGLLNKIYKQANLEEEFHKIKDWKEVDIKQSNLGEIFKSLKFNKITEKNIKLNIDLEKNVNSEADDKEDINLSKKSVKLYYSEKNKIGYLGSWLTHLGILIIIIFFAYGKIKGFDVYVYGVPGQMKEVDNTDLSIYIESFEVKFRKDLSVEQYVSDVVIYKDGQVEDAGEISVNHPLRTNNLNIYQNSTGWAANTKLYKNDEKYAKELVYEGDVFTEDNQKVAIQFTQFYPDFDESSEQLRSKSPLPNHPLILYALFYDGYRVDMNLTHMGEEIEYMEYKFVFEEPQRYTTFQVAYDPGKVGAFVGGAILTLGIFLAMFINSKKLFIFENEEGIIKIYGKSNKNNVIYQDEIKSALELTRREVD